MTTTANRGDGEDLYDESTGEPIAYRKVNPPYGHSPLPTHHAPVPRIQAEPTVRLIRVPAPGGDDVGFQARK
jgi:hypothetical protein